MDANPVRIVRIPEALFNLVREQKEMDRRFILFKEVGGYGGKEAMVIYHADRNME